MDTLNSIIDPREFSDETEIYRQHMDRFKNPGSYTGGQLVRNIDRQSEGVVTDKKLLTRNILQESSDDLNWYLIYRSKHADPEEQEESQAVEVALCADKPVETGVRSVAPSVTYTVNDFDDGAYYYFTDIDNPQGTFLINSIVSFTLGETSQIATAVHAYNTGYNIEQEWTRQLVNLRGLIIHREGSTLKYGFMNPYNYALNLDINSGTAINNFTATINDTTALNEVTSIRFTQANLFRVSNSYYPRQTPEGLRALISTERGIYVGQSTTQTLSTIDDIDRTNRALIKIIKYPYCPIPYTIASNVYNFGEDWSYNLGLMVYNKTNLPELGRDGILNTNLPNMVVDVVPATISNPVIVENESKLYHSDFYSCKFVYDSFVKELKYENITVPASYNDVSPSVSIDFKPTGTVNSKLGFRFNPKSSTRPLEYRNEQDFDDILLVTRNNEETILNDEYMNYIKTGYNYDKKANALSLESAQRNVTVSAVTTGISTIGGLVAAATGQGGLSASLITGGINAAINTANAWANLDDLKAKQENSMQQKIAQLANQSASTSGTDDIDLMSWYSGNRMWRYFYDTSTLEKQYLFNLFKITGYAHHSYATPDVDTRIWYNYVQCNPHINRDTLSKYKAEFINDLIAKYRNGVTVFHHNYSQTQQKEIWEFDRSHENWETWILEGVSNE